MSETIKSAGGFKVFISYAHKDEELLVELEKHLSNLKRQGNIVSWHDRKIPPGNARAGEVDQQLNTAHIILLLISADFLQSDYCYSIEMQRAMDRHEAKEAHVIPIILRQVDWHDTPFSKLQALPKDAKPVKSWSNIDEAFADITRGIKAAIEILTVELEQKLKGQKQEILHLKNGQDKFIDNPTVYRDQWAANFRRLIESARSRIDILQTYVPIIEALNYPLQMALKNGCKVRILTLKHDSPYLSARLADLGRNKGAWEHSFSMLMNIVQVSRYSPGKIEIKAYNAIPYFPYYRIDDRVFIGFYLKGGSFTYPQIDFHIDEINKAFPDLLEHFEWYWSRVDNDDLIRIWNIGDSLEKGGLHIKTSSEDRQEVSRDASLYKGCPIGVIRFPTSSNTASVVPQLRQLMQVARNKHVPLTFVGSRTSVAGQAVNQNGIVVDMSTFKDCTIETTEKNPYVETEPGVILDPLNMRLKNSTKNGLVALSFEHTLDLSSSHMATIGGAIMNNGGGILSTKYGSARDNVYDLQVLLPDGRVTWTSEIKERGSFTDLYSGLRRFIEEAGADKIIEAFPKLKKNSSGYNVCRLAEQMKRGEPLDVTQLFVGSEGTLGTLLRAKVRIRQTATPKSTILVFFDALNNAAKAVEDILKIDIDGVSVIPSALEVISGTIFEVIRDLRITLPPECDPPKDAQEAVLLVEYDDPDDIASAALVKLQQVCERYIPFSSNINTNCFRIVDDLDKRKNFWYLRKNIVKILNDYGQKYDLIAPPIIEDIAVPIGNLGLLLRFLHGEFEALGLKSAIFGHAGDGNLHVRPLLKREQGQMELAWHLMDKVYKKALSLGGTISAEHGDGLLRTPYLELQYGATTTSLFKKIKELFDPYYILNPGVKVLHPDYPNDGFREWDILGYLPIGGGNLTLKDYEDIIRD